MVLEQEVLVEQVVVEQEVIPQQEMQEQLTQVVDGGGSGGQGAGGSGIVIVKELNKASGSWPLRAQFSSRKQGTWPETLVSVDVDYLVVAGGGGGGGQDGGGGAGGYRTSFPGGTKLHYQDMDLYLSNNSWRWRSWTNQVSRNYKVEGTDQYFQQLQAGGGGGARGIPSFIGATRRIRRWRWNNLIQVQEEQEILRQLVLLKEILEEHQEVMQIMQVEEVEELLQ
jgi:hypothetical protein